MSHVFHRTCQPQLPTAESGDGAYIFDTNGKRYLDACGGAAVSCLGHSNPQVIAAVQEQIGRLAYAHTGFFTNEPCEQLADLLVEQAPEGLDHLYLVSGGSEAVESALKLARQYFVEKGEPQRQHFIARRQSYHGNTLGALAVGGNEWRRASFRPLLVPSYHISPCYAYRDRREDESEHAYGQRVANELEQKIQELGAETVIGFIAEPVVGATAGALTPVPGYFKRIREICDRYGILLILDEVMCGMGRTGSLYACEQEEIIPDMITLAKGLGAGYQPIGATLVHRRVFERIRDGSGFFQHGHTYMAHATAAAAALAVQRVIRDEALIPRVRELGSSLQELLRERLGNHPHVGDIRGRGLFIGIELVADRESKQPFAPSSGLDKRVKRAAFENGLMCYPMGGTIDGRQGHHILLAPPFILENSQMDEIVDKLSPAIDRAVAEVRDLA